MDTVHNPDRFMADLRQVLSQGRKRIALLVGAGAPLSLLVDQDGKLDPQGQSLIPGVDNLTTKVLDSLEGDAQSAAVAIKTGLGSAANIETILSRIRLLETALGETTVNGLDSGGYRDLGKSICEKIGTIVGVSLPKERNGYNELVSWISGTLRSHPVEIFTTNYDLLFEEAFEAVHAPYFDGFSGGHAPFFDPVTVAGDDLPSRWSRLWKLHGSIGWELVSGRVARGGNKTATQLVYPDHLKYDLTQKQPYSALFERLKSFLLTPDTLLLIAGFSFRDAHVCAILDEALAMNANTAALAFQYRTLEEEAPATKLAFEHPNLTVYASDGAVIGGVPGQWKPGDLPKNWAEIRRSFWGPRAADAAHSFLLGDFSLLSRFCALSQAQDFTSPPEATAVPDATSEQKAEA